MPKLPTRTELMKVIEALKERWMPTTPETVRDPLNEPPSTLPTLSADSLHEAITSAEMGDTRLYFAACRDALLADTHLLGLIGTRFNAVIGDDEVILPASKAVADIAAADAIRAAIERMEDFSGLVQSLLWGHVWPLSLVERTYKTASHPGLTYDWGTIRAVKDHSMRWTQGHLELERVDERTRLPTGDWFTPDMTRYILHRGHILPTPDCWGGPIRSLLWWFLLKTMSRDWWARFLDRFGTPFPVAKFEKNDDRSRAILERAFRMSSKIGGLVVSQGTQVELAQANTGAADAHERFFQRCCDEQSRAVLGQTLSSTASPTGFGGGASDLQSKVRDDLRQGDVRRIGQTLRQKFFLPWLRLNHFSGAPPKITFGQQEPEQLATVGQVLAALKQAGIRVAPGALPVLSERLGLELEMDAPATGTIPLSALPDGLVEMLTAR